TANALLRNHVFEEGPEVGLEPMRQAPRVEGVLPKGLRGDESMAFDQPSGVVGLTEREQRVAKVLDCIEGPDPQEVLLERSDEALGAAVSLGRPDEGGRAFDVEEFELFLKRVGHVLLSVVVTD